MTDCSFFLTLPQAHSANSLSLPLTEDVKVPRGCHYQVFTHLLANGSWRPAFSLCSFMLLFLSFWFFYSSLMFQFLKLHSDRSSHRCVFLWVPEASGFSKRLCCPFICPGLSYRSTAGQLLCLVCFPVEAMATSLQWLCSGVVSTFLKVLGLYNPGGLSFLNPFWKKKIQLYFNDGWKKN